MSKIPKPPSTAPEITSGISIGSTIPEPPAGHSSSDEDANVVAREKERAQLFFARVGRAITKWAHIDRYLFHLCRFALAAGEHKTAIIFYRSPNIKEHLMLVDALLSISLSKANMKKWKKIYETIDLHLPLRNEIAHNPAIMNIKHYVMRQTDRNEDGTGVDIISSYRPNEYWWSIKTEDTKLHVKKKKVDYREHDLAAHVAAVDAVTREMARFVRGLPKRPRTKPPKSSEPKAPARSGLGGKSRQAARRQPPQPASPE